MESISRPAKRLATCSTLDERVALSKRPGACRNDASTTSTSNSLPAAPSIMGIRAFGLEDRAEAVISRGKESWMLANLSKWRHDALDIAVNTTDGLQNIQFSRKLSSKEFLQQRQRMYRHRCLTSSGKHKQPI